MNGCIFVVSMIWHEPTNQYSDCYFCMTKNVGFSKKNKSKVVYPDWKSVLKPVKHDFENPVPVPLAAVGDESDDNSVDESDDADMNNTDELYEAGSEEKQPHLLTKK